MMFLADFCFFQVDFKMKIKKSFQKLDKLGGGYNDIDFIFYEKIDE